jgi:putative transposase
MHVHLVFVTKFRHKVFMDVHLRRMEEIMRAVCEDFECELVEFNGEDNHVHLLVNFPPKVAVAKLVNSLKGVSSRRLRQEFDDLTGTTGGRTSSGPAPTSPAPSAVHPSPSSGSTSSNRTGRSDQRYRARRCGAPRHPMRPPPCPAPQDKNRDAPRRSHEIRFTTGLKPDALRMKPGSGWSSGVRRTRRT